MDIFNKTVNMHITKVLHHITLIEQLRIALIATKVLFQ